MLWYTLEDDSSQNFIPMSVDKVLEIMEMNRKGVKAKKLEFSKERESRLEEPQPGNYAPTLTVESDITRFDEQRNSRRKKKKKRNNAEDKGPLQ
jgi:hypothetical protein